MTGLVVARQPLEHPQPTRANNDFPPRNVGNQAVRCAEW